MTRPRITSIRLGDRNGPEVPVIWYDTTTGNRLPVIAIVEIEGRWISAYLTTSFGRFAAYPTGDLERQGEPGLA